MLSPRKTSEKLTSLTGQSGSALWARCSGSGGRMTSTMRCAVPVRRTLLLVVCVLLDGVLCRRPDGYVLYCPCMGRFGNQADHFLGALAFARALNRTLVLPPWVEYKTGQVNSVQVPFDTYFKVDKLRGFHSVIPMEEFMRDLAPHVWPPGNRTVLCYQGRGGGSCQAKEGNPFGPFWDTFRVDFDASEFYAPLHYDVHRGDTAQRWNDKYPPSRWPVLAFTGAPASFPVQEENLSLQAHLAWSDSVLHRAKHFIATSLKAPFVGIHLRNGIDWERACEHLESSPLLFSAPQCVGYSGEKGPLPREACLPQGYTVLAQLKRVVRALKARSVFVASDNDHMLPAINEALGPLKVVAYAREPSEPHVDLAILGLANHFVGNCVSSFSAFAKRHRDVLGLSSSFWAFPAKPQPHQEL